jgi:PleD family two-component response regulator
VHSLIPMQKREHKKLLALADLLFTAKISDAAKRAGIQAEFVREEHDLLEKAQSKPALIILDLNFAGVESLRLIAKLKANPELKQTSILAYVSHVDGELKQKAHELGCHMVMARSAFSQNLSQILKRHAGTL